MSEATPFVSVPGLTTIGSEDAGMCRDGVCADPATEQVPPHRNDQQSDQHG